LKDLKQNLPQVYQKLVEDAYQDFLICLRVELVSPLKDEKSGLDFIKDDDSYINKAEYRLWLKSMHLPAEMVFTIIDLRGRIIAKRTIAGYSDPDLGSDLWRLRPDRFRSAGEHGQAIMVLEKSAFGQPAQSSYYYTVKW